MTKLLDMSVQQLVGVIGRGVFPAGHLVVTADDLGFTRGDGVFDATRVVTDREGHSRIDHLDAHLDRFERSIRGVSGQAPDRGAWQATIAEALEQWTTPGEAVLKIMYSNGQETQHPADQHPPTEVFTLTQMGEAAIHERGGVKAALLSRGTHSTSFADAPWLLGGVKSLSYAVNVAVKREALRRGAQDVVFTTIDGFCLEAPTSALVCLIDGELVSTPTGGTGILASITQRQLFDAAEGAGFITSERLISIEEALACEGAWLLSSVRGVVPVTHFVREAGDETALPLHPELTAQLRTWVGFEA